MGGSIHRSTDRRRSLAADRVPQALRHRWTRLRSRVTAAPSQSSATF